MPSISAERLLAEIAALARIGGRPDGGVDRLAGSDADIEGRHWFADRLRDAGLEVEIDDLNNVFGHPAGAGPWLLLGSHTDTVPAGGRLDGAYGCLAALEVVRTLRNAGHPAGERIAVADFHNEEGVVPTGFDGSIRFCQSAWVGTVRGYLEVHIEQGPRLEAENLDLGVVDGIVGIDRYAVTVVGAANHAGTTPFAYRRDAGRVAAQFIGHLPELVQDVDPAMVANVGSVTFEPGAPNVIPGVARFVLEMRAMERSALDRAVEAVRGDLEGLAGSRCTMTVEPLHSFPPQALDRAYVAALERVCERLGRPYRRLTSGAGHDAEILARHVPAAMLFVPSHDGVSHSPLEHTDDAHLALGCQALLEGALELVGADG